MDAYAKERRTRDGKKGREGEAEPEVGGHLGVSLLIGYLQEVDGVSQGCLLQRQGEDQGELLGQAVRKHLTGRKKKKKQH